MNPLKMFEEINHPRPLPASLKDRAKLLANFVLERHSGKLCWKPDTL
jgi:hypothetical protein